MTPEDISDWTSAYIALQDDSSCSVEGHSLFWAAAQFMQPGHSASVDDCWHTILVILSRHPPPAVAGLLAAGSLEDLFHDSGPLVIDRVELEARRNPSFRQLLGEVWPSSTPEIWARVESARRST